jgi:3-deoxy-D-manno-octulosonic-acid transferase
LPRGTLSLAAYRRSLALLTPVAPLLLWQRTRAGKELAGRVRERRGHAGVKRPPGRLVWMHGASVGELLSLVPLAQALVARQFRVLVTSGTVTSAAIAAERLPPEAIHQFVPLDMPKYVERFLKHWQPDLALFAESELWPNLLQATHRTGTPVVIVNGRLSDRSFARWARRRNSARALFGLLDQCLVQSPREASRFAELGAERVTATGNLKFDAPPPPADPRRLGLIQEAVAGRPVFVAASTHAGEEEIVAQAHLLARRELPDLLTVIVPRHPERGFAVREAMAAHGLKANRRSEGHLPDASADIYIADTIGELGLFYRLAPLVFLGGSLVSRGGQNPIEPVRLDTVVLHGPHTENFAVIYNALDRAGGALPVRDGVELAAVAGELLGDPGRFGGMMQAGQSALQPFEGAVARTLAVLDPFVAQMKLQRLDRGGPVRPLARV